MQTYIKVAFSEHVLKFLETYSMGTESAKVDGRVVPFSIQAIGRNMRLPVDGITEGQLPAITRKQHELLFEGEFPKGTQVWRIDQAHNHWKLWFKFVNDYLLFRPHPKSIAQKYVVAAVQTWEGKKINWSLIVQHKIHEEILRVKVGVPQMKGLCFAFNISECCQQLPAPVAVRDQPLTSQMLSLWSSLGSTEELAEENQMLRVQLKSCKESLEEKICQLWKKNEVLINCQSANVKHLSELANAMKEKVENQRILAHNKKTMATYQEQIAV